MGKFVEKHKIRGFPTTAGITPSAVAKPEEKVSAASVCFAAARAFSNSSVGWQGAADEPGCGGTGAESPDSLDQRRLDFRMPGETEIVVRREIPERPAVRGRLGVRSGSRAGVGCAAVPRRRAGGEPRRGWASAREAG